MSNELLKKYGTFLVILSGILYGFIGYLGTRLLQQHFTISAMLFWRFLIASAWMCALMIVAKKPSEHYNFSWRESWKIILLGSIYYSAASAFYFEASRFIGTGIAMVIFFSFPIFVTVLTWFSGTRINKIVVASLLAVMFGLLLLKNQNAQPLNLSGLIAGLIAAGFYATYIYVSQSTSKKINSNVLTLSICLGNALLFLFYSLLTNTWIFPTSLNAWIIIFAIGIFATAIPIQLVLIGLKYVNPVKASILSVFEPLVTVLMGVALLHETVTFTQTLGMMIVLIGVILIQFERSTDAKGSLT